MIKLLGVDVLERVDSDITMANWTKPLYSKSQINKAGEVLTGRVWTLEAIQSLQIINNWRSSHSYPLHIAKKALKRRAEAIDPNALVARRLKRLSSIASKLERFPDMRLARMQDIGGCRAVMSTVGNVKKLVDVIKEYYGGTPELFRIYDYLTNPKADGYRGIHCVVQYQSRADANSVYDGMKIEIQIRSQLQHAWATAVETVSAFIGQALKSNVGDERWKRFFALMGSAIAIIEECPQVPNTPQQKDDLISEIGIISEGLSVLDTLRGWSAVVAITSDIPHASTFLLVLNAHTKRVTITPFTEGQNRLASKAYLEQEQRFANDGDVQVVLVSVDSLEALRRAYPNYYLDTTEFTNTVERIINGGI